MVQKDTSVKKGFDSRNWRWSVLFCLALAALSGCKKSSTGEMVTVDASMVVLSGTDVLPTGAINEGGLKKLANESGKPSISVIISRTRISDAALPQLAKFKNITTLQAPGSQLSDAAVDKLKADVPTLKNVIK